MSFRKRWYVVPHTVGRGSPVETFEYEVFKSTDRAGRREHSPGTLSVFGRGIPPPLPRSPSLSQGRQFAPTGFVHHRWACAKSDRARAIRESPLQLWATVRLSRICKVARAGMQARPYEMTHHRFFYTSAPPVFRSRKYRGRVIGCFSVVCKRTPYIALWKVRIMTSRCCSRESLWKFTA